MGKLDNDAYPFIHNLVRRTAAYDLKTYPYQYLGQRMHTHNCRLQNLSNDEIQRNSEWRYCAFGPFSLLTRKLAEEITHDEGLINPVWTPLQTWVDEQHENGHSEDRTLGSVVTEFARSTGHHVQTLQDGQEWINQHSMVNASSLACWHVR